MSRPRLSVIVTSLNEEVNIQDCLHSVRFGDEVLLVDSFSTDRTVEIARAIPGVRIVQREYFGDAAQKNWAMDQVEGPWILIVDADERIPKELAEEIERLLAGGPRAEAYYIRRENVMVDRVIRHSGWSTDRVVRLLRKGAGRYPNRRVHADIVTRGPVPTLRSRMLHLTFRSFAQYLPKLHLYADWAAADAWRRGKRSGLTELILRPAWRFFRMYLLQAGFLDGRHGLTLCAIQAYSVFLKWARVWELERLEKAGRPLGLPTFDDTQETREAVK
ncbi:MAG TPA: glycosyltransferase family 2 protein [Thermoanaerobaculia bacterium]|nr:glycosyltransferase family 2 protein [Thermoanaerobaculia bacterium]